MTRDYQKKIHQSLKENRKTGIEFLQRLVRQASTQENEYEAQQLVIKKLKSLGMKVDYWDLKGEQLLENQYFTSTRSDFTNSPNVVGVWKGADGGKSIILNGHIDVVPAGDERQWTADPFSGKVVDGKMYGRGVTDMKGGNVSLLLAIEALKASGIRLKGDVIFQSVIEEESGGAGTLAAILRGYKANAAIIPEPTNMRVFPKQQGSMWFRLFVKGRSAHGGTRYEGVSAIEKSAMVVEHIQQLEQKRNERISDPLYEKTPIPVPINIGKIAGGKWPSSVADLVTLEGRIGVSPDETMDTVKLELRDWLKQLSDVDPWFADHPVAIEWFGARWLPGSIHGDHELMSVLRRQYKAVKQEDPIIEASPWGTDGGLLDQVADVPVIVFGPGVTEMAHHPNEYIVLDRVFEVAEILALTLMDWCGVVDE